MNDFTYSELRARAEKLKAHRDEVGHKAFYAELANGPVPPEFFQAIWYMGMLDAIASQKLEKELLAI